MHRNQPHRHSEIDDNQIIEIDRASVEDIGATKPVAYSCRVGRMESEMAARSH